MPEGYLQSSKIIYMNKVGAFNDINIILFDDLYDQRYRLAVVKSYTSMGSSCTYNLVIDGKESSFTSGVAISGTGAGSMMKVSMLNGKVSRVVDVVNSECENTKIDAIDGRRIKIGGKVYLFKDTVSIYKKEIDGTLKMIGTNDLDVSKDYGKVSVYLDKPYNSGGKVETIVVSGF
jgi:hypothetical protein